jgi:predicted nucleic acid-binding protein
MAASLYLVDTNILLRLFDRRHAAHPTLRSAVERLADPRVDLAYTMQNMAEFWNVSTRPRERNGFGLTPDETEINARRIELSFTLLPDNEGVYRQWRWLVVERKVSGAQVHDARLAAAMYAHGVTNILTFNGSDFARYPGITAIHPNIVGK